MWAVKAVHPSKPFHGYLGCIGLCFARGSIAVLVAMYKMSAVGPPIFDRVGPLHGFKG